MRAGRRGSFGWLDLIGALALIIVVFVCIVAPVGAAWMEMTTFNKFSEKKATIWDALFGELRIEAQP